ncbi:MAG: macrolide family glycosyltransferase [Bryobacteraceae bacterium]
MGRIVYFSFPAHGHINPTLPVFRELVRRGQQVVYYGTEQFQQVIRDTGALFCPYSARFRMPEQGPGPFVRISTTLETLLDLSGAVLDDHLEQVRILRPTHVMHDSFAPWGGFVAQVLRLPSIASVPSILINREIDSRYGPGPGIQPSDPRLTPQWYARFRSHCHACLLGHGLPALSPPQLLQTYADLNLVYTSRSFQPLAEAFDDHRFKFVGPCFEFRPEAPPFPFERLDGRPLVLVSLGTAHGNHPQFFRMCMEALADARWQVVLSTGSDFPAAELGPVPENCIVRAFVPQIGILRRCAAFVTHGGMNSVQEALYHGVPMAMAPQAADQFWISARVSELGAGLVLDPLRMDAGAIRDGVAKILSDASYAAAAARIGASLRAAGGHRRATGEIQSFIRRGEPNGPLRARAAPGNAL